MNDAKGEITDVEVVVDGVRCAVATAGDRDSSEAVVFVHGNPGSGRDWTYLIERVAPFARAVAPDMPGYAGSDKPRTFDYSFEGYGRHLTRLLDQLGVSRAHLVLHDFGAPWGIEWIVQNPQAAASVTLLGNGVFEEYQWHRWARMWRLRVIGDVLQYTTPRAAARLMMARENPRLNADQVDRLTRIMAAYSTRRVILSTYRVTPPERYVYRPTPDGGRARIADLLRPLELPALVLWPTSDDYVPFQPEYQRAAFPSARIEIFEGHGHWLHWEAPERTAELIVPFLREQTRAPQAAATDA